MAHVHLYNFIIIIIIIFTWWRDRIKRVMPSDYVAHGVQGQVDKFFFFLGKKKDAGMDINGRDEGNAVMEYLMSLLAILQVAKIKKSRVSIIVSHTHTHTEKEGSCRVLQVWGHHVRSKNGGEQEKVGYIW